MDHILALVCDCCRNFLVTVTGTVYCDAAEEVKIFISFLIVHIHAVSLFFNKIPSSGLLGEVFVYYVK